MSDVLELVTKDASEQATGHATGHATAYGTRALLSQIGSERVGEHW
jgi:hypothetical protein